MKILLCVDGSKDSNQAISKAKELGILEGNEITVFNVISDERLSSNSAYNNYYTELLTDYNIKESKEILRESKEKLEDSKALKIETEYTIGNPSKKIVEYQKENDIDLIIIGSRGLGAFSRTLLGSVSSKVSNKATCSVLVIKFNRE
ncbi:MAG: universal stress protein [Peptoniphilaceae bacterium]|nr:universal stress protein [Peptoniphilaceae bacterium]MDD7383239.1 universal stress protein [Peptoniphilaceae bacterium]MDY3737615.1 universal stress protein [Peptoniphilaceae bacterium]